LAKLQKPSMPLMWLWPLLKSHLVVDWEVFAVALEVVVAAELIGAIDRALDRMVPGLGDEGLLGAVGRDHAVDLAAPFQHVENTRFARRSPAPLALAPSAEAAFVGLDLTAERRAFTLDLLPEALPPGAVVAPHGRVADRQGPGGVVGGRSQHGGFEDLPLLAPPFIAPLAAAARALPLPLPPFPCGARQSNHRSHIRCFS
jgi:hypothetical protein